jgi:uncharacterized RDD family membrane protein YckC
LYEPICIAFFKGTIGQQFINIKVERAHEDGNAINFFLAILRMLLQYALGWISLWTISSSPKKQAIHDAVVKSIVLKNELLQTIRHFFLLKFKPFIQQSLRIHLPAFDQ